jgi:hypothetical protein
MERVTGSLEGRASSFARQHAGTMDRGAPTLLVTLVPDSGTGSLQGLAGGMAIEIIEGRHFYIFNYFATRELGGSTSGPVRLEPGERSLQRREFGFLGLFRALGAVDLEQAAAVEGGDTAVGKRLVQLPKVAFGILADAFPTQWSHACFCLKGC